MAGRPCPPGPQRALLSLYRHTARHRTAYGSILKEELSAWYLPNFCCSPAMSGLALAIVSELPPRRCRDRLCCLTYRMLIKPHPPATHTTPARLPTCSTGTGPVRGVEIARGKASFPTLQLCKRIFTASTTYAESTLTGTYMCSGRCEPVSELIGILDRPAA